MRQCCVIHFMNRNQIATTQNFGCTHLLHLCVQCTFLQNDYCHLIIILMQKSYKKRYGNYATCTLYIHTRTHVWIKSIFEELLSLRHIKNRKHNDTTGENIKKRNNDVQQQNVVHNMKWRTQILIQHWTLTTSNVTQTDSYICCSNCTLTQISKLWYILSILSMKRTYTRKNFTEYNIRWASIHYSCVCCKYMNLFFFWKNHCYWLLRFGICRSYVSLMMHRQNLCARKESHQHVFTIGKKADPKKERRKELEGKKM